MSHVINMQNLQNAQYAHAYKSHRGTKQIFMNYSRDTYWFLDRPCFGQNWSATCALEVSVQLWVSHLVDWFATCTQEVSVQLWGNIVQL